MTLQERLRRPQSLGIALQVTAMEAADRIDALELEAAKMVGTHLKLVCEHHTAMMEIERLNENSIVLINAIWKACGDDAQVVNDTINSQGELR